MRRKRLSVAYEGMRRTIVPAGCERLRCQYVVLESTGKKGLRFKWEDEAESSMALYSSPSMPSMSRADAYSKNKDIRAYARSKWEPCVYFLLQQGRVIYIGSTLCIKQRARAHVRQDKRFDEVWVLPKQNHKELETGLIKAFQPPLNMRHNPRRIFKQ